MLSTQKHRLRHFSSKLQTKKHIRTSTMSEQSANRDYREICSERTIFSDQQGFFGEMFDIVRKCCTNQWLTQQFYAANNDADKLRVLFDETCVSDSLFGTLEHVQPVYRKKDAAFSYKRRIEGEQLHRRNDLNNAFLLLTQAVLRAPTKGLNVQFDGGLTLALAFWSRSAVLLDMRRADDALVDIQCAIDNGYDAIKTHLEYYIRLAKANAMIGNLNKLKICLNLAKNFCADGSKLMAIEAQIYEIHANAAIVAMQVPTLSDGEHEQIPHASKKIGIRSNDESGNFAVAAQPLITGETIVVEKPIASHLLPKFYGTHCFHCLRRIETAYACPQCAGIAFCSIGCQKEATSTYHRYDCKFMDMMIGSGMSILCYIALRLITQEATVDAAIKRTRTILHELCSHSTQRPANDYLQRSVMSAFLLRILQKCGFFGHRTSDAPTPNSQFEYEIGGILIGLLQVLQFNAHEIYETKAFESQAAVGGKRLLYVGAALYHSAAYFNHSCCPDVVRYFVGTTIVLSAARPIRADEMIAENYGPNFSKQALHVRQKNLQSRYWFKCSCVCCREDWPILERLSNKARLRCSNQKCDNLFKYPEKANKCIKCPKCKQETNLEIQVTTMHQAEALYQKAARFMDKEQLREATNTFIDGINLFYSVAQPPHHDTHIAQESLRVCLSNIGRL